ncbi:hypothetical protein [Vibrio parahaemolyticus]|uniref:hypothetical protein n=1 Tax=Vibrio parahaemolyticus TaxID=670 RepID=UPI0004E666F6|nr:hypothetical protein [Vibrio parahaemolyticus]KFE94894.1 hypothetical protein HB39_12370 [Vibrio parahaemolyticus]MBX5338967.1 hypothetical protein [Vibrio parahaemolyticus]WDE69809.1 hypothetical protein VPHZ6_orf00026 [Vibrio phage VPHZ6]
MGMNIKDIHSRLEAVICDYCQGKGKVSMLFGQGVCYRCDGVGVLQANGDQLDTKSVDILRRVTDRESFGRWLAIDRAEREAAQNKPHWYDMPGRIRSNWRGD